ncbi:thioredoxin family protein [Singulisphaera acidiphila]|uniref:Thioredoxin domain protein n=1 Tax=Singulisphaera acidiphila (strain ATCC BAA-1392 / DSM 18658 / VKM B-2454 / MOB10) TaxID=886293 RepID=L0D975_SINAD|nr:thioredoxin family protein [Singulisphaera acidiphila]AGA25802.1 thioredoxin domain protein [Singulisphaera acidiphila DSM 18658]
MTHRKSRSIGMGLVALLGFGLVWLDGRVAEGAGPAGIEWRSDLQRANAEAKAKQRLLWVQFTGSWCHFCTLMDGESFIHPKIVGQSRQHFVPIKLQCDTNEEVAAQLGVTGLPATILVSPSGEIVAKHEGYLDPESFHAFLESARARMARAAVAKATAPARGAKTASDSPAPPTPPPARVEASLALSGFCPVSLVQDHRLVQGQNAVSLEHEGHVYRFANPVVRDTFQRQPERFIPVNSGRCPVKQVDRGQAKSGEARFGVLFQGHLYLCSDDTSRVQFMKNPERYCHVDLADRGLCPHCWGHDFVLAKGQPQWSPTRDEFRDSTAELAARRSEASTRR